MTEDNKFDLILADPPWWYPVRDPKKKFGKGAFGHYPLMKKQEILDMGPGVQSIARDDALLFLWVTWPRLDWGMQTIEAWGFKYVTSGFVWVKGNKSDPPLMPALRHETWPVVLPDAEDPPGPFFGVGNYTKSNTEFCLLARRGKTIRPRDNHISELIISPLAEHSRKPNDSYHRIEKMYPDLDKVELFARKRRDGWHSAGLEVNGQDLRKGVVADG
jgi:site-specific DNA-methyltransferase (adenine-specific)